MPCGPKPQCQKATPNCSFPVCVFGRDAHDHQNISDECIAAYYATKAAPAAPRETPREGKK